VRVRNRVFANLTRLMRANFKWMENKISVSGFTHAMHDFGLLLRGGLLFIFYFLFIFFKPSGYITFML